MGLSTVMPPQAPKKDARLNSDLHLSTSPFEFNSLYKAAPPGANFKRTREGSCRHYSFLALDLTLQSVDSAARIQRGSERSGIRQFKKKKKKANYVGHTPK